MSRNTKIVLGLAAALLVVCLCGAAVLFGGLGLLGTRIAQNTSSDAGQVANRAQSIADFQLPEGWQGQFSMGIAGVTMVGFRTNDPHGYAMMMQFPASMADPASMERQFQQSMQRQMPGAPDQMQTVGQQQAIIRGQPVTLKVSEGTNGKDGVTFHALTGIFQGKGGPVLLSVGGPKATWNEQEVAAFIASIR